MVPCFQGGHRAPHSHPLRHSPCSQQESSPGSTLLTPCLSSQPLPALADTCLRLGSPGLTPQEALARAAQACWDLCSRRRPWLGWGASLLRWAPLPVPAEAGASWWGRELQWWPCPLRATQQWCLASMVAQTSSTNLPGCGSPHSLPFRLSPHSQQLSPPWVHSPNSTFQHLAPLCTRRHLTQAGVHQAAYRTCA